ncbi:glutamate ABC transporter substrate-binding protein [Spirillospora sp. NPDC047279]|uniref:glutamate ABC transporter substrate-binding protein n=1 Tax=Spirillospora sp. NPDC047279 TaxID=3155478 RepID=UPI0033C9FBBD
MRTPRTARRGSAARWIVRGGTTPRAPRRGSAALMVAATGLATAACGLGGEADAGSILHKRSLVVGVKEDQPSLGLKRPDGTYEGFDVDVAKYVVAKLGVPESRITFRTTPSSERETALASGKVDLIFATYSITAQRKTKVSFGGPYYVPHQDTLIRASDDSIKSVRDLKGKRLCAVKGSNSWKRVIEERKIAARTVDAANYGDCLTKLLGDQVDAISTDDVILAGFAAGRPLKIINAPFTDEKYGIGLKKGDLAACEAVNRAVTQMYQEGKAEAFLKKWFGTSGLRITTSVPQFEGCT